MAAAFAARYKKDLSTEALKTKLAHRKSISQKESRHKEFNKGRKFELIDVNAQASRNGEPSLLEESGEGYFLRSSTKSSKKSSASHVGQKSSSSAKSREQERLEMLQRYKAEKELRKLNEQRKPIFKCGQFKPEAPGFLLKPSNIPVLSKPKETVTKAASVEMRLTRSKVKNQLQEPIRPPARPPTRPPQSVRQIYVDKPPKERKGVQPSTSTTATRRPTRATAAALTKIPQISRPAVSTGIPLQKKEASKSKPQQREVKNAKVLCGVKENHSVEPLITEITLATATELEKENVEKENLPAPIILAPAPQRRERSFAPQNFVFKPLEGLMAYKVKPMSPSKADVFLSPNLCWSPAETTSKVPGEGALEALPQDCGLKQKVSSPGVTKADLQEHPSVLEFPDANTECVTKETMDAAPFEKQINPQKVDLPASDSSDPAGEPQHNVPYFRNLLRCEAERLASHCLEWDGAAEADIPEDAKDLVRTTVGQTRLLIAERFKQFEGLVDNCEFRRGEKETTCDDLDGFWDMVNFQVEDVKKKFENLRKLQENRWQMADDVQAKRPLKKKTAPQRATKAGGGSVERRAARRRLAAIKAAMKNKMKAEGLMVEAAGQETPKEVEKVTFDGGFFKIESPRPFPGRTPQSTSRTSRRMTPRSANRALLQSCADTCVVTCVGTPTASSAIPPLLDLSAVLEPARTDLRCISEQCDIQAAEEPCATAEDVAKEAADVQTATCDSGSPLCDMDDLISTDSQGLEGCIDKMEVPEAAEEVKQTIADLGEQDVLSWSPKEDSQPEGTCSQDEELPTPECQTGSLLGDFSCNGAVLELQPSLDGSLLVTPRNQAEKFVANPSNDLIVFSPLT
ncbi:disks large-associated protein 5 [Lacerta agilis]|uniref:disks large-associated protein 5 n=1 Tax=Lacerta agilis TaxID=80427 RepID=UPI00141995EC|nr:disks large-associated protein 5 [Lacerta agilis]